MGSPADYVCDVCGSDDVGGICTAREIINGPDAGKLEDWGDSFQYYDCGNCSGNQGEVGVVQRQDYASEQYIDGPWVVVNKIGMYADGTIHYNYLVKMYHHNGEHVATWEGPSMESLSQTKGPSSIKIEMADNLNLALSLVE